MKIMFDVLVFVHIVFIVPFYFPFVGRSGRNWAFCWFWFFRSVTKAGRDLQSSGHVCVDSLCDSLCKNTEARKQTDDIIKAVVWVQSVRKVAIEISSLRATH